MDQARPLLEAEAQRVQHAVDVLVRTAAALHRQSRRLVEHDHVIVAMYHHALDLGGVAIGNRRLRLGSRLGRRRIRDAGRQADRLARLDTVLALGALAVDPDLTGAQQLLQRAVAQFGEVALKPPVEAHASLVVRDGAILDLGLLATTTGRAVTHGAQTTGQATQGPWNRCPSTR